MERLKDSTISSVMRWARAKGLLVFIDVSGRLSVYPKTNPAHRKLEAMLVGRHPEVKMFLIKDIERSEE